ncbi:MAG: class I SAM-dependent methyltransferase [Deltaproteobacteria bacterium]|nr:class I SAM-dependent methyltransferase [Deltaproteobacteria bacterium]
MPSVADKISSEHELAGIAMALGAATVPPLSLAERHLLEAASREAACGPSAALVSRVRDAIAAGYDPLGEAFCMLRPPAARRGLGATFTPTDVVGSMLAWAERHGRPVRVVDPGAGSGRFIVGAGRIFKDAQLVAVELDPLSALLTRASACTSGLASRAMVLLDDYRSVVLPRASGPTLFVGNPPYVRHHDIERPWKQWLTHVASRRGLSASQRSGMHVHFFLATLEHACPGDYGAFITAAEWLDVNYGSLVRQLFLDGLGGTAIHVLDPSQRPFPDAASTAAITCFQVGSHAPLPTMRRIERASGLGLLEDGPGIERKVLEASPRWTILTRPARELPTGFVELGELCRVRRGQVTGANDFWIAGPHAGRLPGCLTYPAVTRAKELFRAGSFLEDHSQLRRVIDLPADLSSLPAEYLEIVEELLHHGRARGVDKGYVARHRRAWWSVGLHEPAPILATYMARRAPAFVRNLVGARHINIAHGIYPRERLPEAQLDALAAHLAATTSVAQGRTYAGGLTKFEPREMERLPVPAPCSLVPTETL